MPLEIEKAIRIKGMIDASLAAAPSGTASSVGLVETYIRVRGLCAELVAGTEAESEFATLYPPMESLPPDATSRSAAMLARTAVQGEHARVLLAGLAGWLGSWPSAERLLAELIAALEQAEAEATEPAEKERLAGLLEGLKGAGREIAVGVVTAYLTRVHV